MKRDARGRLVRRSLVVSALLLVSAVSLRASAFTQHAGTSTGNVVPMGHEWITRLAAIELLGGERFLQPDAADPRKGWTDGRGMAKNTRLDRAQSEVKRIKGLRNSEEVYAATYQPVWGAIIGERWVDIGGNNFTKSKWFDDVNCLDMVTQQPADIQHDHFMRRYDEVGGQGGIDAAKASKEAFVTHFVNAATARKGPMRVYDGGAYATLVTVDRNYFLFGRALHLLEDSFSLEHAVRIADDRFEKVRQVKSYLCAPGSEQHDHPDALPAYTSGDVIWNPSSKWDGSSFTTYKPSNMKPIALAAVEATKDAWAAFIRTMALGGDAVTARNEAEAVAARWLALSSEDEVRAWYKKAENRDRTYVRSGNAGEDGGNGRTVVACMKEDIKVTRTQAEQVKMLDAGRRTCLYNMVPAAEYADNVDPALHLAFNWEWRSKGLPTPPADWRIDAPPPPLSPRVKLISRQTHHPMRAETNDWIYCDGADGYEPLEFDIVGPLDNAFLRVVNQTKFLNQSDGSWGQVGLWTSSSKGQYKLTRREDGSYNIFSNHWNLFMYVDDAKPFVHKNANASELSAQWVVQGLPEPELANGIYSIMTASDNLAYVADTAKLGGRLGADRPDKVNQGTRSWFSITRISEGRYIIGSVSRSGLYVQAKGDDGKATPLTFASYNSPVPGPLVFFLEEDRGTNAYRIRSAGGHQVWRELPDKSLVTEAQSFFVPPPGCEDNGVPGMVPAAGKVPPPNFGGRCNDPQLFVLRRQSWP